MPCRQPAQVAFLLAIAVATACACVPAAVDGTCPGGLIDNRARGLCQLPHSEGPYGRCGADDNCRAGLVCRVDGRCVEAGSSPGGSACGDARECQAGLTCRTATAWEGVDTSCLAPRPAGEACEGGDGECAEGLVCRGEPPAPTTRTEARCEVPLEAGAACGSSDQCAAEAFCDDGTCGPAFGEGAPCLEARACRAPLACTWQEAEAKYECR